MRPDSLPEVERDVAGAQPPARIVLEVVDSRIAAATTLGILQFLPLSELATDAKSMKVPLLT